MKFDKTIEILTMKLYDEMAIVAAIEMVRWQKENEDLLTDAAKKQAKINSLFNSMFLGKEDFSKTALEIISAITILSAYVEESKEEEGE